VTWAVETALGWHAQKPLWQQLVQNAMAQDFSWESRVGDYEALYERMISAA
jgi:glycogen synthase